MNKVLAAIKNNPVRVYSILVSVAAVAASFGFSLSASQHDAVFALVALVLGGGEVVRSQVSPV